MARFGFSRLRHHRVYRYWLLSGLLLLIWLLCSGEAYGGVISDRLQNFPNWSDKPLTKSALGDLVYPDWMAGTWEMTSTLVEAAAPLAPTIKTPGFEGNLELLDQPITCLVRFTPKLSSLTRSFLIQPRFAQEEIVADRAFNGLSLARAYLGEDAVKDVKIDPRNPNRQLTVLQGDRQLESTVTGRAVEPAGETRFLTTEVFQQVFRGIPKPYFNEVETTTDYRKVQGNQPTIIANQVTAVYLSPQDPKYFQAANQPIALYRYELKFIPPTSNS